MGSAAGSLPGQRDVALAGCILALQHAAMLERVVTMASPVPWPPDSGQPPDFSTMPTHPPADLRLHVACAVASQGATELAQPYQAAIVAGSASRPGRSRIDGADEPARRPTGSAQLIAPTLLTEPRGWLTPAMECHGPADVG